MPRQEEITITGNSQFTDPLPVRKYFIVTIKAGTLVGTVALQRQFLDNGTWDTVETFDDFTLDIVKNGSDNTGAQYRIGTTAFTSGSTTVRIEQREN